MNPFSSTCRSRAAIRSLKTLGAMAVMLTLGLGAQAQGTPAQGAGSGSQSASTATPAKLRTIAIAPVDVPASLSAALQSPAEKQSLRLFSDLVYKEVTSAINRTGTFQVVQRQDLAKILAEQDFGQSGNVNPQTAAKIGELIGAEVLATIDLLQFDYMIRSTHAAAINRDIVTVSLDSGANLNLLDTTTGAILATTSGQGSAVETKQYFANAEPKGGSTVSRQQGGFDRVPVTEAAQNLANSLVEALTTEMFPTRVLAVTGKQATLNRGIGYFKNGEIVDIIQYGAELRDPDTGRSLGREEVLIGQGKVLRVTAQTATISLTEDNGVQPGQVAAKQQ